MELGIEREAINKIVKEQNLVESYQNTQVRMKQNVAVVVDYERVTVNAETVGRCQTGDLSDWHIHASNTQQIRRSYLNDSLLPNVFLQVFFGGVLNLKKELVSMLLV